MRPEQGDSFVIAKRGKPGSNVTQIIGNPSSRRSACWASMKGIYTLPENFEEIDREMDQEIEKLFLGEDEE